MSISHEKKRVHSRHYHLFRNEFLRNLSWPESWLFRYWQLFLQLQYKT